jgi:hypothetical protein
MTVGIAMPTMVVDAVSTSMLVLMSMLVVSESMSIGGAELMAIADDKSSTLVGVERSAMVGEGASESVDPDPIVSMVGAN